MKTIICLNCIISVVFTLCYAYQFFYIFVGLLKKPKETDTEKRHKFAVVISARNERDVIGQLIQCINKQNYPTVSYTHLSSVISRTVPGVNTRLVSVGSEPSTV